MARSSLASYRELCTPSLNTDAYHVLQPWHRQQGQVNPPRTSTKTCRQWRVDLALREAFACVACLHVVEGDMGTSYSRCTVTGRYAASVQIFTLLIAAAGQV